MSTRATHIDAGGSLANAVILAVFAHSKRRTCKTDLHTNIDAPWDDSQEGLSSRNTPRPCK